MKDLNIKSEVEPCKNKPCDACPWRTANQGIKHPHGWYTKTNLRRLWAKLRRGESMTCHPTDPRNEVPDGIKPVPQDIQTFECAGAVILKQREFMKLQHELVAYYKAHPKGLTRIGAARMLEQELFSLRTRQRPNLNADGIGYEPLGEWDPSSLVKNNE